MTQTVDVYLTVEQEIHAARIGGRWRVDGLRRGGVSRHETGSMWGHNIEGACAEYAVALWTGLEWNGPVRDPGWEKLADVGTYIEVRQTAKWKPRLRIDRKDKAKAVKQGIDYRWVLAVGWAPHFELAGWMTAAQALGSGKDSEKWKKTYDEREVWEVPRDRLEPMSELLLG